MTWTPELMAQLKDLWAQGKSTAEIGRRLGISKNAVVGKAHRLALAPRPSPIKRQVMRRPVLRGPRCQWPIGDPRSAEFSFCEAEAAPGKPYCSYHCQMAYTRSSSSSSASSSAAPGKAA